MLYSNPRLQAEFNDWPIGGANRGKCVFKVEDGGKKGVRVSRTTQTKHGTWATPKYDTYCAKAAIVDGEDGKTYILKFISRYGFECVSIVRSDFKNLHEQPAYESSEAARFGELMALIDSAK